MKCSYLRDHLGQQVFVLINEGKKNIKKVEIIRHSMKIKTKHKQIIRKKRQNGVKNVKNITDEDKT